MSPPVWALALMLIAGVACPAAAQATAQLWSNVTVDWLQSERLTYEMDFEPKGDVYTAPGRTRAVNLQVTSAVEYAPNGWFDLVGDLVGAYTHQNDGADTLELSPRIGVRLHIMSQIVQSRAARRGPEREKQPRRRLTVSTLMRLEQRNLFSGGGSGATGSWRFRDRGEVAYPLNRPKLTSDGAVYLSTDAEAFVPVGEHVAGGIVNQIRVRSGIGYRSSFAWRVQVLYMWTGARETASGALVPHSHAIDVRIKRVF